MWLPTTTVESITRPRLAVAVISAVAAASIGFYAYRSSAGPVSELPVGGGLHRSNAIRRTQRSRRTNTTSSLSSETTPGDENVDVHALRPLGDGETIVEGDVDDWWHDPGAFPPPQRAGHNIVNLLFRVSEDNARRNGCVHRGCQCNSCGMVPIRGVRYRCANCADFDLCETCEAQGVHNKTHIFYKIRVPAPPFGPRQMQPVWYTGDPDTCRRNLPRALIAKLSRETGFERPELEAFWEQWTFMASTEWRDDPDDLCVAMDRKTFERCLVPTGGSRHAAPNLIHDRMFSFYDSNNDDLIGFSEFLQGLSYRKRKDKLRKVFEGYDIDGDGFVNRKDFLRMFRAYYVLYKQMHKDILDGLEDQLLASTEAQQLVNSRQPLSSLFGREGRVPSGDGEVRLEGKEYHADGSVNLTEGSRGVVLDDKGDTATREDILTSLFAYETDERNRRRFISRNDTDTNWRTVRRLSGSDTDRTYWVTLLEPPTNLEELPELLMGSHSLEIEDTSEEENGDDENRDEGGQESAENARQVDSEQFVDTMPTDSETRARVIAHTRRQAPKAEKRRRDMARRQLHERWRRRQFYLDEEEGGLAPDDWEDGEDILVNANETGESSKSAEPPLSPRSRSSSKVRFAEDMEEYEVRSNPSTSSRSIPERWGAFEIPDSERDAGKEILYQVTQQAFNELLDTIFKEVEDLAVQAGETRDDRLKYAELLETVELADENLERDKAAQGENGASRGKAVEDKTLDELLSESGYSVAPQEARNAVELDTAIDAIHEEDDDGADPELPVREKDAEAQPLMPEEEPTEYRDPTLPQFRQNSLPTSTYPSCEDFYPLTKAAPHGAHSAEAGDVTDSEPSLETLQMWKRLTIAEEEATKRQGWGKLSFREFEEIYKRQEHQGNRLDYLGSWIDFCIP